MVFRLELIQVLTSQTIIIPHEHSASHLGSLIVLLLAIQVVIKPSLIHWVVYRGWLY